MLPRFVIQQLETQLHRLEGEVCYVGGTEGHLLLTADSCVWISDGKRRTRLEVHPARWRREIPEYLQTVIVEDPFGGRDYLGRQHRCCCGERVETALVLVHHQGRPVCRRCATKIAPFLLTICDGGLVYADQIVERQES